MFKFGFSKENNDQPSKDEIDPKEKLTWLESTEIANKTSLDLSNSGVHHSITCGKLNVKYLSSDDVVHCIQSQSLSQSNSILSAEQNHSDLLKAIYEGVEFTTKARETLSAQLLFTGGLKIWECTYDLINFINTSNIDFEQKKVLDLGCGAGLVGILGCLKGATCCFQDYNREVIELLTISNVVLNCGEDNKHSFFCGDWLSFSDLLAPKLLQDCDKFDYIFTSETIYNPDNYDKLCEVFGRLLKKTGTVYLAAKSYYFGVGGGISQFEDILRIKKIYDYSTVWECNEGIKRTILEIKFK